MSDTDPKAKPKMIRIKPKAGQTINGRTEEVDVPAGRAIALLQQDGCEFCNDADIPEELRKTSGTAEQVEDPSVENATPEAPVAEDATAAPNPAEDAAEPPPLESPATSDATAAPVAEEEPKTRKRRR